MPVRTSSRRETRPSFLDGVRLDAVGVDAPAPRRGETGTYTALLQQPTRAKHDWEVMSARIRYDELLDRGLHAGDYDLFGQDNGMYHYTESTPAGYDYSLLVALETPKKSVVPSRWGLLDRVEPVRPPDEDGPALVDIDLLYLAPREEFRTKTHLRNTLEYSGI